MIEEYRQEVIMGLYKLKGNRSEVGVWAPSCAQHGFSDSPSFLNDRFRVPSRSGIMVGEVIAEFLKDPWHARWDMDTVAWPNNQGCNGISQLMS